MTETLLIGAGSLAVVLALGIAFLARRRSRQRRDEAAHAHAVSKNLHLPASLHPVIDPDRCIGSLSCLQACPEGDILGVVDGRAKLITAANCIGHGKCALECPVDAIKLVFGTHERGVDLPDVDEFFESSRSGIHIVGELGGMGLIRNAIRQGLQVAERLAATLPPKAPAANGIVDVAIVGAGPAGLSAAVGLRSQGRSFRVLEQGRFGGTIAHYPRQKVVMTETVELPIHGRFGKKLISKEELLETWTKVANKASIRVEEGMKVTAIDGQDGAFSLQTPAGPVVARKVVLATGRRGSPRKLGAPGEELEKVTYGLEDPEQYAGARVLVVGGGDAALEAAIQLTEETDAEVTLSYRGEALGRCREANRQKFQALVAAKRLRALLPSTVTRITTDSVDLDAGGTPVRLPNDYVIVNIGGELPLEMLKAMGVALVRHHGTAPGEHARHGAQAKVTAKRPAHAEEEARKDRRLAWMLFLVGAVIIAGLAYAGWDYYGLPRLERRRSPLHDFLRPAGTWGHGIGIAATAVMLSNFLYSVRKRLRLLKGTAPIRRWLTFHVFVGFMSPVVIAFHAAFQSNNLLATTTAGSLAVVVLTGMVGRFVYGLVPTRDGRTLELPHVTANWERLKSRVEPMLTGVKDAATLRRVLAEATAPPPSGSLFAQVLRWPFDSLTTRLHVRRLRRLFPDPAQHRELRDVFLRLARLRVQVGFYRGLKRFMSVWRVFHVVLAVLLVVMIAGHIGLSLYLGYGWILF